MPPVKNSPAANSLFLQLKAVLETHGTIEYQMLWCRVLVCAEIAQTHELITVSSLGDGQAASALAPSTMVRELGFRQSRKFFPGASGSGSENRLS